MSVSLIIGDANFSPRVNLLLDVTIVNIIFLPLKT